MSRKNKKFENEDYLIKELKKFNEKAFDYFVLKYQEIIISFVNKYLNDKDEAWNVSQEVFISVFRNINDFRNDSSLKTWLFKIARNYALNRLKYLKVRKKNKHSYIDDIKEKYPNYEISITETPFIKLKKRETVKLLNEAIGKLSDKDKEIIILRDLNELSYDEISEILNVSLGAVKSRLFRARENLKKIYEKDFNE